MIQRVQSLFLIFATITSIIIIYFFPVLYNSDEFFLLKDNFTPVRISVLLSAALSFFTIFQFKNRRRQIILVAISRFINTISICLLLLVYKDDKMIGVGSFLLFLPFVFLYLSQYFIKKDDALIKSADRIR